MAKKKALKKKRFVDNSPASITALKRNNKIGFLLNDKEKEALDFYCKKNKVKNRSKFMRETILRSVMSHFVEDYPSLFDKKDMDKIKV